MREASARRRLRSVGSRSERSEELSDASRNPVSREAASARRSAAGRRSCRRRTSTACPRRSLLGDRRRLRGARSSRPRRLGLGFAVRVTTAVGARITSNCTSVGVEPDRRREHVVEARVSPSRRGRCSSRRSGARSRRRRRRSASPLRATTSVVGIASGQSWLDQIRSGPQVIFTTRSPGETWKVHAGWRPSSREPDRDRLGAPRTRHRGQHADLVVAALPARVQQRRLGLALRGHRGRDRAQGRRLGGFFRLLGRAGAGLDAGVSGILGRCRPTACRCRRRAPAPARAPHCGGSSRRVGAAVHADA